MSDVINPSLKKSKRSGIWEIRWTERLAGRYQTRTRSTGETDFARATTVYNGWKTGEEQIAVAVRSPFVSDILDDYRAHLLAGKKGETQFICLTHLDRGLGRLRVGDLTPARLLAYRDARGVSAPTLRRELGALRAALGYAEAHRRISRDDAPRIDLPQPSAPRKTYLRDADERAFHQAALDHTPTGGRLTRLSRFVAVALDTAARREAICELTWDRIDLEHGVVDFAVPGATETNKRRTSVPINARLRPVLERAYAERTGPYFLDHPGSIRAQWRRWIDKTKWAGEICPHDLRRTFASLTVMAGVPIEFVAEVLADNPNTVRRHYAHLDPRAKGEAVNARFK